MDLDKVCDNVKDCGNGADECGTCQFEEHKIRLQMLDHELHLQNQSYR